MNYPLDTEIDLRPRINCKYFPSSQHRKVGNENKCVWTISTFDEVECFVNSKNANWVSESVCWGLKLQGLLVNVIGKNYNKDELKIAKFIDSANSGLWHGYPADYLKRTQDIPATPVLQIWVNEGYISKSDFRKIRQGMPCNL